MEQLSKRDQRLLAALADGHPVDPAAAARVAASPQLQAILTEQRAALAAIRAARPEAPGRLRAVVADRATPTRRRGGSRLSLGLATAGVVALAIVALAPAGRAPSVAQAAALASRAPTGLAPRPDPRHPEALSMAVDGIRYPYWEDAFGWRAAGARSDRLNGRAATTVYYRGRSGARLGYTIVGGAGLAQPAGAMAHLLGGTRLLSYRAAGTTIVTWRRAGHTCVLAATGVPLETMLALAAWRGGGEP